MINKTNDMFIKEHIEEQQILNNLKAHSLIEPLPDYDWTEYDRLAAHINKETKEQ